MPKFTVQLEYLLPSYMNVTVEARDETEACMVALETDNWESQRQDFDLSSDVYVAAIEKGEDVDCPTGRPPDRFRAGRLETLRNYVANRAP